MNMHVTDTGTIHGEFSAHDFAWIELRAARAYLDGALRSQP